MSIQRKFFVVISTTLTIVVCATSAFNIYQNVRNMKYSAEKNAITTIEMAVMSLNKMYGLPQELEELSSELLLGQNIFFSEIYQLLKNGSVNNEQFESILSRISTKTALNFLIINSSGKIVTSLPSKKQVGFQCDADQHKQPQASAFMQLIGMNSAENFAQNIQISDITNELMKYVAIKNKNQYLNVIGYQGNRILKFMNVYSVESMAEQFKNSKDIDAVWVLDPHYKTITFTQNNDLVNKHNENLSEILLDLSTNSVKRKEILTLICGSNLYAACPFYDTTGNMAGTMMTVKNIAYIQKKLLNQIIMTIVITIFSIFYGVFGGHLFFRRLSREIKDLSLETKKITSLDLHEPIVAQSDIEDVRSLQRTMQMMKQKIMYLSAYVSKDLIAKLFSNSQTLKICADKRDITVLHSQILNISELSEKVSPQDLMWQLSLITDSFTTVISTHKGITSRVDGGVITALWGAPTQDFSQAYHACRTALLCRLAVENLNQLWREEGRETISSCISVHTGEAIVGNMGSAERMHYTAVGNVMSVAHLLGDAAIANNTSIIISEPVYKIIKNFFTVKELETITPLNNKKKIRIYELVKLNH